MIFTITRDTTHDGMVAVWEEGVFADLELDDDGNWMNKEPNIGLGLEFETTYESFQREYGLCLNRGQKKIMVSSHSWRTIEAAARKDNEDAPISVG